MLEAHVIQTRGFTNVDGGFQVTVRCPYYRGIWASLLEAKGHPSVEEIRDGLLAHGHRIGLATIYRTIKILLQSGFVRHADEVVRTSHSVGDRARSAPPQAFDELRMHGREVSHIVGSVAKLLGRERPLIPVAEGEPLSQPRSDDFLHQLGNDDSPFAR